VSLDTVTLGWAAPSVGYSPLKAYLIEQLGAATNQWQQVGNLLPTGRSCRSPWPATDMTLSTTADRTTGNG
jgi:hypothetical protein